MDQQGDDNQTDHDDAAHPVETRDRVEALCLAFNHNYPYSKPLELTTEPLLAFVRHITGTAVYHY